MREKDFRGAHVWIGAVVLMRSFMVRRFGAAKICFAFRLVMMRVLDGGVGSDSGGRFVRSSESPGEREERLELGRDDAGVDGSDMMMAMLVCFFRPVLLVSQRMYLDMRDYYSSSLQQQIS